MNGHSDTEPAAGLEPVDAGNAGNHVNRFVQLEGATDRAADLLRQALTQGFGNGEAHVALLRQALEVLQDARLSP